MNLYNHLKTILLRWTGLFLRFVVLERNLTKCECNCLDYCDGVQFGIYVYVTAHSHSLSNQPTRNIHSQCIILH